MENNAKPDQSFRVDDLLNGKLSKQKFQVNYLPMYHMLDNLDKKVSGGLAKLPAKEIWEAIYDFGVISTGLDKADMQTRVDELNRKNLEWFTRASTLDLENVQLKKQIQALKEKYGEEGVSVQGSSTEGIEVPTETNNETQSDSQ